MRVVCVRWFLSCACLAAFVETLTLIANSPPSTGPFVILPKRSGGQGRHDRFRLFSLRPADDSTEAQQRSLRTKQQTSTVEKPNGLGSVKLLKNVRRSVFALSDFPRSFQSMSIHKRPVGLSAPPARDTLSMTSVPGSTRGTTTDTRNAIQKSTSLQDRSVMEVGEWKQKQQPSWLGRDWRGADSSLSSLPAASRHTTITNNDNSNYKNNTLTSTWFSSETARDQSQASAIETETEESTDSLQPETETSSERLQPETETGSDWLKPETETDSDSLQPETETDSDSLQPETETGSEWLQAETKPMSSTVSSALREPNTTTAVGSTRQERGEDRWSRVRRGTGSMLAEGQEGRHEFFSPTETCRQRHISGVMRPPGCTPRLVRSSSCEGTCHSRSVPQWDRESQRLKHIAYCTCCKPHRLTFKRISFHCPGRENFVFYLGVATQCACRPCSDGNPRHRQPYDY